MDDPPLGRGQHPLGDLPHPGQGLFLGDRLGPRLHEPREVGPLDVLHDQDQAAVRQGVQVVDGHDMRGADLGNQLRLLSEPFARAAGGDRLECHEAVKRDLPGLVDDPHRAPAELVQDLETVELGEAKPLAPARGRRGQAKQGRRRLVRALLDAPGLRVGGGSDDRVGAGSCGPSSDAKTSRIHPAHAGICASYSSGAGASPRSRRSSSSTRSRCRTS